MPRSLTREKVKLLEPDDIDRILKFATTRTDPGGKRHPPGCNCAGWSPDGPRVKRCAYPSP